MSAHVVPFAGDRPPVAIYAQGDGWLMGSIGNIKVTYLAKALDDGSFAKLAAAIAKQIDESVDASKCGVLYEVHAPGDMDARRRKTVGQLLNARKEKLSRTTAGYVLVTSSQIVRGLLTAVFWFAPPPYPWNVTGSVRDGLAWLSSQLEGGIDVQGTVRAYVEMKERWSTSSG